MEKTGYKELTLVSFLKDRLLKSLDDYLFEEEFSSTLHYKSNS